MTSRSRKTRGSVPAGVVARLPIYFRYLLDLDKRQVERISSAQLGEALDFTAAQIRSDLSYFGSFGQQGYGYNVQDLLQQVKLILGLNKQYAMVLIGAGNLGKAIASYKAFQEKGFLIKAIFELDPSIVGKNYGGCLIRPSGELEGYLESNHVDIAIIATPQDSSQDVCDRLVKCGVKNIWNFAPAQLVVPEGVITEHIHLTDSLLRLAFRINARPLK